jgi:hypothetical protein
MPPSPQPPLIAGDPNLDPKVRARVDYAAGVLPEVLEAAKQLRHTDTESQLYALALYGSITELYSACTVLANWGEPTAIPIIERSMYEALVDLDNLLQDPSYHCRIEHANIKQTLKIMRSGPLRGAFDKTRYEELDARRVEIENEGKASLEIWQRAKAVGRSDEYESLYALFCLDGHNNASALAERHLSERKDGMPIISFFGPYEAQRVIRRLDFALQWLFEASGMIHSAFQVPAPRVRALAESFDRERRERVAAEKSALAEEPK